MKFIRFYTFVLSRFLVGFPMNPTGRAQIYARFLMPVLNHIGASWAHLRTILGHLGASYRSRLGTFWGGLGAILGHLGAVWPFLGVLFYEKTTPESERKFTLAFRWLY
jgi:hypothetical protein